MPKRKHTTEEKINKLREVAVVIASGGAVAEAVSSTGVSEQTFYRWRSEYGGLRVAGLDSNYRPRASEEQGPFTGTVGRKHCPKG